VKTKIGMLELGEFSMSLNVKDLAVSKAFYEKLGFEKFGGDEKMNYLILKNEETVLGLFQGMFEGNNITFNPGWDQSAQNLENFTDVRNIQTELKAKGLKLDSEADVKTTGPASIVLTDPDGNQILLDQHV
jgi:lactoylglutathione lyase